MNIVSSNAPIFEFSLVSRKLIRLFCENKFELMINPTTKDIWTMPRE